jgi:hypothetical protein
MTEQPWVSAEFYLPRNNHMPCEVELTSGKREKRDTTEGDWKLVVRWRSVEGKKKGKD